MQNSPKPISTSPFAENDPDKTLQTIPRNKSTKRIFVAATQINVGKTTTCLGLYAALKQLYQNVGFIKPVGQRFIEVEGEKIDEDSYLLDSIYDVRTPITAMSPIAVDGKFTRRYIQNPEKMDLVLRDKMIRGFDRASFEKDIIIIEGSGHAGVGSVFNLSNAQVAQTLDAKAIIVAPAGIGRPIDEITLNKALFDRHGVEIIGVILNKAISSKIEMIREYTSKVFDRLGITLLGIIPEKKDLAAPNLSQIVSEIDGQWINGRLEGNNERILNVMIGAMTAKGSTDYLGPGVLMITSGDREDLIYSTIAMTGIYSSKVVSGIILTRDIIPHPKVMEMLGKTNIPVVLSSEDSYTVASKIHSMTVKTQPQDTDKIPIIKNYIAEHVDISSITAQLTRSKNPEKNKEKISLNKDLPTKVKKLL